MAKRIAGVEVQDMPEDMEMVAATLDAYGREVLDPTPLAPPVGYQDPPTIEQMIRSFIHNERIQAEIAAQGFETEEEANDFGVPDDIDPFSEHEYSEEEEAFVQEQIRAFREAKARPAPQAQPEPESPSEAAPAASVAPLEGD